MGSKQWMNRKKAYLYIPPGLVINTVAHLYYLENVANVLTWQNRSMTQRSSGLLLLFAFVYVAFVAFLMFVNQMKVNLWSTEIF